MTRRARWSDAAILLLTLILCYAGAAWADYYAMSGSFNGGTINRGLIDNGGLASTGSVAINGICGNQSNCPAAPAVTPGGGPSTTYYGVALDINGLLACQAGNCIGVSGGSGGNPYQTSTGGGGNTMPSAGTTANGGTAGAPATVTMAGMAGMVGCLILKGGTGALLDYAPHQGALISGQPCTVTDSGQGITGYGASTFDQTARPSLTSGYYAIYTNNRVSVAANTSTLILSLVVNSPYGVNSNQHWSYEASAQVGFLSATAGTQCTAFLNGTPFVVQVPTNLGQANTVYAVSLGSNGSTSAGQITLQLWANCNNAAQTAANTDGPFNVSISNLYAVTIP
jgi:hypothetical protein